MATAIRWRLEDDPEGQGTLFDEEVERHIGRGEFRGLEFLHVRAERIINTLPPGAPLPFRHTINAYRGCSHACVFCFARPTHDYLGLNTTDDFDSKIVVKINAVERLRAELDPRRWPGDPIAMGTNTDPYQRCEGKYHLTRGLIEALLEHGNPFSILTKSTLILRDLDLLAESGQRGLATASLSVGTLDEQVWRESEPGTPHPRKRLEAVARLNEAGLPTGVLMGPILPGLSDDPAQLEEVVKGAVEAGATSISSVLLHLRPGVREVYLPWLERTHPELVERYQKLYAGSYAPKADRQRVSDQVRRLISRFRGTPAAPFFRPRTPPAPTSELPAGPRQLPLL